MEDSQEKKPFLAKPLLHYLHAVFLPVVLALIFLAQNQAFNTWLGLSSKIYEGRFLAVNFGLGLVMYGPALFFKKRGRYIWLFLVSTFISLVFLSQFLFFQYAQSFLQVSALKYINQASSVAGTIMTFLSFKLLLFILNIVVVICALALSFRENVLEVILSNKEKVVLFLCILLIAFGGYFLLINKERQEWGTTSRLYKDVYDLNTLVEKIGIVNFSFEDATKFLMRRNLVSKEDKAFLKSFAQTRPAETIPGKPKYFGLAKGKNIIFLQVESLQNSVINQEIGGQEITPNLNKLASEGMYFDNYYTQVGPGNTADAEFSTLDSLYPLQDDVVFVDYAQNTYHALPNLLVKNQYHTYSLHGDVPTFWNRANIYPNLGYQQQFSEDDYLKSRPVGKGPSDVGDEDFLLQSLIKAKTFKQPFFATFITMSSHTPFELPKDLQTLQIPADTVLSYTQQQYLQSVHYADKAIGEFIAGLRKTGIYDNSVVFIYGDHGGYTGITDALGNPYNLLPNVTNQDVPMIMLSGLPQLRGVRHTPMSHVDLYPTVTNLLGLSAPKSVFGQDIFNAKTPVVFYRNIISGTMNTIITDSMAFQSSGNGIFENGSCISLPDRGVLPVEDCRTLYGRQSDTARASDIIVRGNLLDFYTANLPK